MEWEGEERIWTRHEWKKGEGVEEKSGRGREEKRGEDREVEKIIATEEMSKKKDIECG